LLLQPDLRGTSLSIFFMTAMSSLKRALSCQELQPNGKTNLPSGSTAMLK
jgi:hypothetical protein